MNAQAQEIIGRGSFGYLCARERVRRKALAPQIKREAIGETI
jgi:hypothetical protein